MLLLGDRKIDMPQFGHFTTLKQLSLGIIGWVYVILDEFEGHGSYVHKFHSYKHDYIIFLKINIV